MGFYVVYIHILDFLLDTRNRYTNHFVEKKSPNMMNAMFLCLLSQKILLTLKFIALFITLLHTIRDDSAFC
jgi:hypothetical protein